MRIFLSLVELAAYALQLFAIWVLYDSGFDSYLLIVWVIGFVLSIIERVVERKSKKQYNSIDWRILNGQGIVFLLVFVTTTLLLNPKVPHYHWLLLSLYTFICSFIRSRGRSKDSDEPTIKALMISGLFGLSIHKSSEILSRIVIVLLEILGYGYNSMGIYNTLLVIFSDSDMELNITGINCVFSLVLGSLLLLLALGKTSKLSLETRAKLRDFYVIYVFGILVVISSIINIIIKIGIDSDSVALFLIGGYLLLSAYMYQKRVEKWKLDYEEMKHDKQESDDLESGK